MALATAARPLNLQQLASRLDGVISPFTIIDNTSYTGAAPGRRIVELRAGDRHGEVLGWIGEYPTAQYPFVFTPNAAMPYGALAPVVDALHELEVRFEAPTTADVHGSIDLDELPF